MGRCSARALRAGLYSLLSVTTFLFPSGIPINPALGSQSTSPLFPLCPFSSTLINKPTGKKQSVDIICQKSPPPLINTRKGTFAEYGEPAHQKLWLILPVFRAALNCRKRGLIAPKLQALTNVVPESKEETGFSFFFSLSFSFILKLTFPTLEVTRNKLLSSHLEIVILSCF